MAAIINPVQFGGGGGGGGVTLLDVQNAIEAALTPYDADFDGRIDAPAQEPYRHVQAVPSDTWVIPHNMNGYPQPRVRNELGEPIEVSFDYTSPNTLEIYFSVPTAGEADLSF